MKNISVKLIAVCAIMLFHVMSVSGQTVKKHIVDRGETLASIASLYGVTQEEIIQLNPDAARFVYVGMELSIPERREIPATTFTAEENKSQKQIPQTEAQIKDSTFPASKLKFCFEIGYGFLDDGGMGGSAFAYEITMGANYYFLDKAYAGARIGYNSSSSSNQIVDNSFHFLEIPLEAGYEWFTSNGKFGLIPFGGFDFNIGLKGKTEIKRIGETDAKIGGKTGIDMRLGLRFNIMSFILSGSYHIPLNDNQKAFFGKDAYPEISIGWQF